MGATVSSGPYLVLGTLMGSTSLPDQNIDAGPSVTYQGDALPDVRQAPINKDNLLPGTVKCHQNFPYVMSCDYVPSGLANNNIVAAASPAANIAMTLAGASTGISTAIPFLQGGTPTVVTANIAIDFGFDSLNVTSGSATATPGDITKYFVGMPLVVANVGNSGATTALLTYVTAVGTSTITMADKALATNSAAPVGAGDAWGALYNGPKIRPTWAQPYIAAGDALILNPYEGASRGLQIVCTTLATGGHIKVSGYDFYGYPQSETITVATSTHTYYTKKTYRFITSITPDFTDTGNIKVGTADTFGFGIRSDKWEYMNIFWGGAFVTTSPGWQSADTTNPATQATGDVRGYFQINTAGPLSGGSANSLTSSGTSQRLAVFSTVPTYNLTQCSPSNTVPFYGVTPV